MINNVEEIKFKVKELALKIELERNQESCISCSIWRTGGEMSISIRKCDSCGERKAFSDIKTIINQYANELKISYDDSWDLAYKCLEEKTKEAIANGKTVYFDEDYFHSDLPKFYKNIILHK